jgi:diguanylate cyclase (GGDEF)-like protein/PAS domain S-box-containing protein
MEDQPNYVEAIVKKNTAVYSDVTLVDNVPNIFCIKDNRGRWIQANLEYLKFLNIQYINYIGKTDAYLAGRPNSNSLVFQENIYQDNNAWEIKRSVKNTVKFTLENGDTAQYEFIATPVFDKYNQPFRLFITGQKIETAQKERSKFELLTSIFFTSHLSFLILDNSLKIASANTAFYSLLGYSQDEIRNKDISCIVNPKQKKDFCKELQTFFKKNSFHLWSEEIKCKNSNGDLIPTKFEIKPILSKNDTFDNYFVTLEDITVHKQNEKRLSKIAHYDHLTGLVNRVMFLDRMDKFLSKAMCYQLHAVIFFIDLDKFKVVNDTLGHDAGDSVLQETAKRLLSVTKKEDVVARFSGDEFAIVLLNEKTHEKAMFAASLVANKIIKCLDQAYYIRHRELFVGSSVGISIYPEDGLSTADLLKNADFAMYEAKNKGRNNFQFYKKEYGIATQDRLVLEISLRKAIDKKELQLFYQPQYSARSREISGAEVLIRWFKFEALGNEPHEKTIIISPDQFIPIAEESGLIIQIGEWVLETACKQLKAWHSQGFAIPKVSVNVSARQFMDDGFMQSVDNALNKSNLEPEYLELEITESMLIGDLDKIELLLKRLKKMGIKIALDDFGTGYSSLSYLKKFPIDVLKIDQSFIRELTVDSTDANIASAIIQMGHSLDQKIVAEGVENETQLIFLCEKKCDFIQGYYFSKPLPVSKMSMLLEEYADTNNQGF